MASKRIGKLKKFKVLRLINNMRVKQKEGDKKGTTLLGLIVFFWRATLAIQLLGKLFGIVVSPKVCFFAWQGRRRVVSSFNPLSLSVAPVGGSNCCIRPQLGMPFSG